MSGCVMLIVVTSCELAVRKIIEYLQQLLVVKSVSYICASINLDHTTEIN